jgi:hypothetical protein
MPYVNGSWAAPDGRAAPAVRAAGAAPGPAAAARDRRDDRVAGAAGAGATAPGSIPLRPLSTGDILDGTFATIRRNPRTVLGLSAIFVTAQELVTVAAQALAGQLPAPVIDIRHASSAELGGTFTGFIGYVLAAVVGAVLTGAIVVVVSQDVLGRRTSIREVTRTVRPRLGALLVAAVIAGALPYLGLVALVAPGVLLWGAWSLTTPALIVEGLGPVRALRRSWRLAVPSFWRVWGIRALAVLIGLLMQVMLLLPFGVAAAAVSSLFAGGHQDALPVLALGVAGDIVAGTVVAPFLAGVLALLYVDQRMRTEALDIVWQRQLSRTGRLP